MQERRKTVFAIKISVNILYLYFTVGGSRRTQDINANKNIKLDCPFLRDLFQKFNSGMWQRGQTSDVLMSQWVAGDLNFSLFGSCSPWFLIKWSDTDDRFWSALLHLVPSWSEGSQDQQLLKIINLFEVRVLADSMTQRWFCLAFGLQLLGFWVGEHRI